MRREWRMAKFFILSTVGSENPTKATLALLLAKAAIEEGHTVDVSFAGDAGVNVRDSVIDGMQGVGFPRYRELFDFLVSKQVNFHV
jgi:uncharacterized protein involved in oxidation of intracellular sulfur